MPDRTLPYDAVLLNGTVGAGKTSTAEALSALEGAAGRRHAVVDLDQIRVLYPRPDGDPFAHEVELANLRDLARNYRAAGAERLVVAGVVEDRDELPRYRDALQTDRLLVVLLVVDPADARARLVRRHEDDAPGQAWHLDRTGELAAILDRAAFADVRIDTTGRTPDDVAREVQRLLGWSDPAADP